MTDKPTNNDQKSGRDSWLFDNRINISLPTELTTKELHERLVSSRVILEERKQEYAKTSKKTDSEMAHYIEVLRAAKVVEAIKDRLALKSEKFNVDEKDIEHPNKARDRISSCFIVTAIYGGQSQQLNDMRWFRDSVLKNAWFGNDIIRWYYENGPNLVKFVERRPITVVVVRQTLNTVIFFVRRARRRMEIV